MKIEVNEINTCKREMLIEVPPESLKADYDLLCQRYRRNAKVPGFRPGKAPLAVILSHYKGAIREDFLENAVHKHLQEVLKAENLDPLHNPAVQDISYEDGGSLSFRAVFEVLPKLTISNYKGLEIDRLTPEVKDEEVEASLGQMQERMAEYVPVEDRPVQRGDFVVISYMGKFPEGSQADLESKDVYCEVGGANTLRGFTENLEGAVPGESKTFTVSYEQNHPNRQLAGKEVQYQVLVHSIKHKKLPELNEEFAKNVGSYSSLGELRAKIREDQKASKSQAAKSDMQEKVLEIILEQNSFEVPEVLVERQTENRLNDYIRALIMQGVHPQTLDVNWSEMRQRQRQRAEHDVRVTLLLEHIADLEQIEVSQGELDEEIAKRAREAKQSVEVVKSRLTKDGGTDRIKNRIRNQKTLELLLSVASFKNPQGMIIQP